MIPRIASSIDFYMLISSDMSLVHKIGPHFSPWQWKDLIHHLSGYIGGSFVRKYQVCICHKDQKEQTEKHPGRCWQSLSLTQFGTISRSQKTSHIRSGRSKHHRVKGQLSRASSKLLLSLCLTPPSAQNITQESLYLLTRQVWLGPNSSVHLSPDRRKTTDAFDKSELVYI